MDFDTLEREREDWLLNNYLSDIADDYEEPEYQHEMMCDKPYKAKVVFIGINEEGGFMNVAYEKNDNMLTFTFDEIGDRIFLTREEAEKTLKEREQK